VVSGEVPERRRYLRQPIGLEARIETPAGTIHEGTIENFSLGGRGLLVSCAELADEPERGEGARVTRGDTVEVHFAICVRDMPRDFRLSARVVDFHSGGLGIEFLDPQVRALVALQDVANKMRASRQDSEPY